LTIVGGHAEDPGRVVMDAGVLLRVYGDSQRERIELYRLHDLLIDRKLTSVLSVKAQLDGDMAHRYEFWTSWRTA
jgi:hypothetical protein